MPSIFLALKNKRKGSDIVILEQGQEFTNRSDISHLLGGNPQSGITLASKTNAIPMIFVCILG